MHRSGIWYKVRHPMFDKDTAYQAVHYCPFSETAWANIVFILPSGHTWGVQQKRCTALKPEHYPRYRDGDRDDYFSRLLTTEEAAQPWAKPPEIANPDLDTDL